MCECVRECMFELHLFPLPNPWYHNKKKKKAMVLCYACVYVIVSFVHFVGLICVASQNGSIFVPRRADFLDRFISVP